jgi:HK97 family phage major capsid protein
MTTAMMTTKQYEDYLSIQKAALDELNGARRPAVGPGAGLIQKNCRPIAGNPWRSAGEFFQAVKDVGTGKVPQHRHTKMQEWGRVVKATPAGMNEMAGPDGGFLVPPEFVNNVLMRSYDNDLLGRTTIFPVGASNTLKIPAVNEKSRVDGQQFGGVTCYWEGEAQGGTETKPSFEMVELILRKLLLLIRATDELISDTPIALETLLDNIAGQVLTWKIGNAIVNGTGVGQPLGLLNSPSLVPVSRQTPNTITAQDVLNMYSRLWTGCKKNAVWICGPQAMPALQQMTIGTAGANMVVYTPPGGLSGAPYATLQGRPILEVEFCPDLGTPGDLILTDLSQYLTATKGGTQTAVSIYTYFESVETVFRFYMRLDGRSWWLNPLTPSNGSTKTLSNIVSLK